MWQLKENQHAKIDYSDTVPRKIHVLVCEAQHTRLITNGFAT